MVTINTTKAVSDTNAKETAQKDLEQQVRDAAVRLKAEKMVKVSIPKGYEKFTGPTVPFGINGVMIVLPVDGQEYDVPAPYKAHVQAFLDNLQM